MSYKAVVTEVRYVDPSANSSKFYRAYALSAEDGSDFRVLYNWGRIGAKGQFSQAIMPTEDAAMSAAAGKIMDKERKGYDGRSIRELRVVPDDLLEQAGVSSNARSQAAAALSKDPFASLEAGTDRLIRLVTGPADVQSEAIMLKRTLDDQLAALRNRLTQAEGSLELAADVLSMKLGA